tara:strand:+ start:460 stop:948 length:489 start_codon:yes stop_codon:yes gene_type:complete
MADSYSLDNLECAVEDALSSDCTPEQVFNRIKLVAKRTANYHRICARDAQSLVDLLEGVDRTEKVVSISSGIKIDDLDREMFKLNSDHLNDSIHANSPYNDGWTRQHYHDKILERERDNENNPKTYDEMVEAGYMMTGDGFWMPDEKRIAQMKHDANEEDGA